MIPFHLEPFLEGERVRVEAALEPVLRRSRYRPPLVDAIRYAVAGGGKRLRPVLVVAGYRAFHDAAPAAVYELALALELLHTYSLVHDDLPAMDDDDVRRGRAATHIAFGVPTATLAGAALIPLSVRVADGAARALGLDGVERRDLLLPLFAAAGAGGMVGGQVLDLEAEGRGVDLPELEDIHRRKTGALLGVAPWLGGCAARAGADERDALRIYGAALGLAFQIADDILDVTGTTAVLGKTAGRDHALEKATFAGVVGLDVARARAWREVETALTALEDAGIRSAELEALARFAVERDR